MVPKENRFVLTCKVFLASVHQIHHAKPTEVPRRSWAPHMSVLRAPWALREPFLRAYLTMHARSVHFVRSNSATRVAALRHHTIQIFLLGMPSRFLRFLMTANNVYTFPIPKTDCPVVISVSTSAFTVLNDSNPFIQLPLTAEGVASYDSVLHQGGSGGATRLLGAAGAALLFGEIDPATGDISVKVTIGPILESQIKFVVNMSY